MRKLNLLLVEMCLLAASMSAQSRASFSYRAETGVLASEDHQSPLWLTANRYGVTSLAKNQTFLRAGLAYQQELKHHWRVDAGLELVGGKDLVSDFWVHQAYADVSWRMLNLSIGSKERAGFPLVKNERLSSGWMVEGMNVRPIPQVRAEIRNFLAVPGTKEWLSFKGHLAYGWFLDGNWQEEFVSARHKYTKEVAYHSKSLMLRLGNSRVLPLEFEFGILMAMQFAGKQYLKMEDGSSVLRYRLPSGAKAYWKAFFPQGADASNPIKGEHTNIEGNVLGSWNFSLNWYPGDWMVRGYYEHYFEDHSQMFWEYGRWKDGQLGFEVKPPKNRWIESVVWECMATKDQSGPFEAYSEYWPQEDFLLSGGDSYYNHGIYQAWQYFGMGIGNPLLPGPIYNDGSLTFKSNRVRGHHVGVSGVPSGEWNWRVLASFVRHWGTYAVPLDRERKQFSGLAEVSYLPRWAKGWSVSASLGLDRGNYLGNHVGGIVSLRKCGGFGL